jgi:hypothetical protein
VVALLKPLTVGVAALAVHLWVLARVARGGNGLATATTQTSAQAARADQNWLMSMSVAQSFGI